MKKRAKRGTQKNGHSDTQVNGDGAKPKPSRPRFQIEQLEPRILLSATWVGTSADDSHTGSNAGDHMKGQGGDDTLHGGTGADSIYGGTGADHLYGHGGNDYLNGNGGNDYLESGDGNSTLLGGSGADTLNHNGTGNAMLKGGGGNDTIYGGTGNDEIHGGSGADDIYVGAGDQKVYGESGNDTIHFDHAANGHVYTVSGSTNSDTIDLSMYASNEVVQTAGHIVVTHGGGSFTINHTGIETVKVGASNLAGNSGTDTNAADSDSSTDDSDSNFAPDSTAGNMHINEDSSGAIHLAATDADGDAIHHYTIDSLPDHGSLALNGHAVHAGDTVLQSDIDAGHLTYTPDSHWHGDTTLQFRANDGTADSMSDANFDIHVDHVNHAPSATDGSLHLNEDGSSAIHLGATDADGDAIHHYTIDSLPDHGSLMLNGNAVHAGDTVLQSDIDAGHLTYTPDSHWHGDTSFGFHASDGSLSSANAGTFGLHVDHVNHAPNSVHGSTSGLEDSSLAVHLAGSDSDQGDTIGQFRVESLPDHGTLMLNGNAVHSGDVISAADIDAGHLTFNPDSHWGGSTHFNFSAHDGQAWSDQTASFDISISNVNHAPTTGAGSLSTLEDATATSVTLSGTDPDAGGTIDHYMIETLPDHGTLMLNGNVVHAGDTVSQAEIDAGHLTFAPDAHFHGSASFNYRANDGEMYADNAGVFSIDVAHVNHAPNAVDGSQHVNEDGSTVVNLHGFDSDQGDVIDHYVIDSLPDHGTLMLNGNAVHAGDSVSQADIDAGHLTFTPDTHWSGDTSFGFHAHDGQVLSDNAGSFGLHVDHVNHAPTTTDGSATTNEDGSSVIHLSGSDPDGDTIDHYVIDSLPDHGTLMLNGNAVHPGDSVSQADIDAGHLTFAPDSHWSGDTSFGFHAHDGQALSDNAGTFGLHVDHVNHAPTATDGSAATNEDGSSVIHLSGSDSDGDAIDHYVIDSLPVHGTLMLNGNAVHAGDSVSQADVDAGHLTFAPDAHWSGDTSFGFHAHDGQVLTDSAGTFALHVDHVNHAPSATNGSMHLNEDGSSAVHLGATDPDGDPVDHYVIDTLPDHGTLLLNGNVVHAGDSVSQADIDAGHLTFAPDSHWHGDTSFGFHAHDGQALSANAATFGLHVDHVNHAPTATDGSVELNQDGSSTIHLAATDSDGDAIHHYVIDSLPAHGTLMLNGHAVHAGDSISQADIDAGNLTFAPAANWHGDTSIGFHAHDGQALSSNVGAFAIHVDAVNHVNEGSLVTLSDPQAHGSGLTHTWRQIDGPDVTLNDVNAIAPTFTAPNVTNHTSLRFEDTVSDGTTTTVNIVEIEVRDPAVDQIRTLDYTHFRDLTAQQVDYLTAQQIATIPNSDWFATMSADARASLDATQVHALDTAHVSIANLTPAQREWLTDDQIQHLNYTDFRYLSANGVDHLTAQQVSTIPNSDWFATMSADARASLDATQVQGLDTAHVSIANLTPAQREWLTDDQIQHLNYTDFRYLSANGVDHLTAQQVATIPNSDWFATMSADARASLDATQVHGLNTATVSIANLTPAQREWLTDDQIQHLNYTDFRYLSANGVDHLTAQQVSTIPNSDWFATMSADARASLDATQVHALDTAHVSIANLTPAQREWLTDDQIQHLNYTDFRYLSANGVDHLTAQQVSTIPNSDWFATMSADARASLDATQVQGLDTAHVSIANLTSAQREWLTDDQIQHLGYTDFRYLSANGVDHLTAQQVSTIPNSDWFATMSADARRASLDATQVQALHTPSVSIANLTTDQREWLTDDQIQHLNYTDFRYLSANGVDHLTAQQVSTIPNSDWFATMSSDARASLDATQVLGLNTAAVSIANLTPAQREWLTDNQIQHLSYTDFRYVPVSHIPQLTTAQMASIPNADWFNTMSMDARNALTSDQIYALRNSLSGVSYVGTTGNDVLSGNSNVNKILGNDGNDTLSGGGSSDVLDGGTGNDLLISGGGNDYMSGGTGNDTFQFTGAQHGDVINVVGGDGTDTIDLSQFHDSQIHEHGSTITVDLGSGHSFTINQSGIESIHTADGTYAPSFVPVNHAPAASDGSIHLNEDGSSAIHLSATDSDGSSIDHYVIDSLPAHGSLMLNGNAVHAGDSVSQADVDAGHLTFTPDSHWSGDTSFGFHAHDGQALSDNAGSFSLHVDHVNHAPIASTDGSATTSEDGSTVIHLSGSDPDGDTIDHYVIDSLPAHGSLMLNGNAIHAGDSVSQADVDAGHLTFTPDSHWSGDTSFGFHAHDGQALSSNSGTFGLHVEAPSANSGSDSDSLAPVGHSNDGDANHTVSGNVPLDGFPGNTDSDQGADSGHSQNVVSDSGNDHGADSNQNSGESSDHISNGGHGSFVDSGFHAPVSSVQSSNNAPIGPTIDGSHSSVGGATSGSHSGPAVDSTHVVLGGAVSGSDAGNNSGNHVGTGSIVSTQSPTQSSNNSAHTDAGSPETVVWSGHEDIQVLNPLEHAAIHVQLHGDQSTGLSGSILGQVDHESLARSVGQTNSHELIALPSFHDDATTVFHTGEVAKGTVHSQDAFEVVGEIHGYGNGFVGASYISAATDTSVGSPAIIHNSHYADSRYFVVDEKSGTDGNSSKSNHAGNDDTTITGSDEAALNAPAASGFFASLWSAVRGLTATADRMVDRGSNVTHRRGR